jgi:hypothetical protein
MWLMCLLRLSCPSLYELICCGHSIVLLFFVADLFVNAEYFREQELGIIGERLLKMRVETVCTGDPLLEIVALASKQIVVHGILPGDRGIKGHK